MADGSVGIALFFFRANYQVRGGRNLKRRINTSRMKPSASTKFAPGLGLHGRRNVRHPLVGPLRQLSEGISIYN
jgi:hypothetical protein